MKITGIFPEDCKYGGARFIVRPTASVGESLYHLVLTDSSHHEIGTCWNLTRAQVLGELVRLMR